MIKVYMETNSTAELIALFDDEDLYVECYPTLKAYAERNGWHRVTESIEEGELQWEIK